MGLYFFKPVVWNDYGYRHPGGGKFISGYPAEHGFGHEEWNNSDRLIFSANGRRFRVFHTEKFGNQPLSKHEGRIFVFMIASLKGDQYLVSIAGQSTSLFDNEDERRRLVRKLHLSDDRWKEAWELPSVRRANQNDRKRFLRQWKRDLSWFPTWICPADSYLPLRKPLLLHPKELTGRDRLITMYGSYQEIDRNVAVRVLDRISPDEGRRVLINLKLLCSTDEEDAQDDLMEIEEETSSETTRRALINARLGQGQFREELIRLWNSRCAVTECGVLDILRASHVKPWRACTNKERLDPYNGLLLTAHWGALFDAGLVSFEDDGSMLISKEIPHEEWDGLALKPGLVREPPAALRPYLAYHRKYVAREATLYSQYQFRR